MRLPGADKRGEGAQIGGDLFGPKIHRHALPQPEGALAWIESGAFEQRGKLIALEIHRDKTDVFCFIRNGSGAFALRGLAAGMVDFEDHRVLEAIQTPGAAIETGA